MKEHRKKILLMGLMVAMTVFAGCSKKEEAGDIEITEEETVEPVEDEEEVLKAIGTEDADALKIRLKNSTGMDIKSVSVKKIEDAEFAENMLEENDVYVMDEERYLYYIVKNQEEIVQEETVLEEEKLLTEGYDIQLTFDDDTIAVLHAFPMEDMEEGEILFEEGIAYLKYESLATKEMVETKEAELAVKAQQEAEAQRLAEEAEVQRQAAEAEAQRQAEEAQRQAEEQAAQYEDDYDDYSNYDYDDYDYDNGDSSDSNSSSTNNSDNSAGGYTDGSDSNEESGSYDDGCLDGGLLY